MLLLFSLVFFFDITYGDKMTEGCCPEEAYGRFSSQGYIPKGVRETVNDMTIYRIGQGSNCVIWNYDIFGFFGERTFELADLLASQGFMVLIPDYYRGTYKDIKDPKPPSVVDFLKEKSNWKNLKKDWENTIRPYAQKHNASTFGAIGTCWGSYMVMKLCSTGDFKAGISVHPAHSSIIKILEEDERKVYEQIKNVPQLFFPTGSDDANVKENGLASQIIAKTKIIYFPDRIHGFFPRGELSNPDIKRDVDKTFDESVAWFKEYLV